MKRLTLIVSGKIQKAGYREKVIDIGKSLGLSGYSENLPGGRVRIIAEGEEDKLELFKDHINIQNTLIKVSNIKSTFGNATGEFSGFSKLVKGGETDERLDTAATLLKELIDVTRSGFGSIKEDTSAMLVKQDGMLEKQDKMLGKQDLYIEITRNGFNDVKNEIKDVKNEIHLQRDDFKEVFLREVNELHIEINEIKATLARMQTA
ncbi:MAG: acylphosphatase [Methanobacteriota archaeon]